MTGLIDKVIPELKFDNIDTLEIKMINRLQIVKSLILSHNHIVLIVVMELG